MAALEIIALDEATPQLRAPGAADTYLAPRALALTPVSLTGSAATSSLSIAQTWNTTGTPTALDVLVTDTASNAASRFFQFRTTARTVLQLRKDGLLQGAGPSSGAFIIGSTTEFRPGSVVIGFQPSGTTGGVGFSGDATGTTLSVGASNLGLHVASTGFYGFSSGTVAADVDTILRRDAANTLALRNGTNAQTSRVYGTFTDASNGRWLNISMTTAGVATITPTGNGTGASGNVIHISGLPTSNPGPGILWNNAGTPAIGT